MACVRDFPWSRDGSSLSVAVPILYGFRFRSGRLFDQRHGTKRRGVQFGAQRRAGARGRADRALRHRRILLGSSAFLSAGDCVDDHVAPRTARIEQRKWPIGSRRIVWPEYFEGWKFSWRNYEVRVGLLVVSFAMFLLIPFTTLLPVFARDILQVGARGQGILLTCMGIGALFSSVLVAFLGDRMPRGLFMIGGVGLYGILLIIFAASSSFALSMALMFMIGLCHVTSHALIQIVVQSYSPSEFRGRTMAIFHMTQVILVVGAMFVGALASLIGARWATISMSVVGTLAMIAIYALMPRARRIQ